MRRTRVALLGLAIVLGAATQGSAAPLSLARQVADARLEAIADGNLAGAIAILRPVVAQATGSLCARAACDLGDALDDLGRVNEARQAYLQALQANPEEGRAARDAVMLGGFFGIPVASASPSSVAPEATGLAAGWQALLPDDERAAFDAQVEAFARQRAAQDLLAEGSRMWQARSFDQALAIFDELVTQFPAQLKASDLLLIGDRAEAKSRPALAVSAYEAGSHREDPARAPWAIYQLGRALMQVSDMNEARVAFGRVLRAGARAKDPEGHSLAMRAEKHLRECRGVASWSAYLTVRELFHEGLSQQYREHDPALAAVTFRRIVNEFPNSNFDGRALVQLAEIAYFDHHHDQAALQDIAEILDDRRQHDLWPDGMRAGAWALYYEGRIRESQGDRAGATIAYHLLLTEYPDNRDHGGKLFAARARARLSALEAKP